MHARLCALAILVLLAPAASRADVFTVNATLDGYSALKGPIYGTLSGTETIDTVKGVGIAFDITAILDGQAYHWTQGYFLNSPCIQGAFPNYCQVYEQGVGDAQTGGDLSLDTSATGQGLVGYKGGGFCGGSGSCYYPFAPCCSQDDVVYGPVDFYYVATGGLTPDTSTPIATTPEPASLLLLGTGLLGTLGALRHRRQQRIRRSCRDA